MSNNPFDGSGSNPFGGGGGDDSDRTIIRPNPGGFQRQAPPPPPQQNQYADTPTQMPSFGSQQPYAAPQAMQGTALRQLNPLVDSAAKLLALIGRLRTTAQHNDVSGLHRQVKQEIQMFEASARSSGASQEAVIAGRYTLCAAIDETVLNTPWGSNSSWSNESMLITFHQEAWGGEKVFQILDRIRQNPAGNIDLLELIDICIAMGFEGKYRVQQNGRMQLEAMRDELFTTIRMHRGEYERELSPQWQGIATRTGKLTRYIPYWVIASITGALMLSIYIGFNFALHSNASPLIDELEVIATPQVVVPVEKREKGDKL